MPLTSIAKFLVASFGGAQLSLIRLLTGFARVKYVALVFGTVGTGLLGQANQLCSFGISIGSLSIAVGIINSLTSQELASAPLRRRELLSTAFSVQLVLSLIILLLGVLASERISFLVFGLGQGKVKLVAIALSIPFSVLASGYLEGILFGLNRYDLYVRGSMIASVGGLLVFFPLVYFFSLDGAFWSILAGSLILFLVFTFYASQLLPLSDIFSFGIDLGHLKKLLGFGGVMLTAGVATYGSSILLRRLVLGELGVSSLGLMQVPLALTAYYSPFLTNALWGRLHPLVAAKGDTGAARGELCSIVMLTLGIHTFGLLLLFCLKEVFVRIAYSQAFVGAIQLIPIQLIGDYFYFMAFTFSVYFLGVARLRLYLIGWVLYFCLLMALTVLLLPRLQLTAIPTAYLATNFCFALPCFVWLIRGIQPTQRLKVVCVVASSLCIVLAQGFLSSFRFPMAFRFILPLAAILGGFVVYQYRNMLWPSLARGSG